MSADHDSQNTASLFGVSFVAGLFWQPLAAVSASERSTEVRSLAKELNLSLFVEHPDHACAGFSRARSGKGKWASLACAVVAALSKENPVKDFIYTAPLSDGRWYYLAQKDGVILSDGDAFFDGEDHARAKFFEDQSIGEWAALFTPVQWGISDARESTSVDDLLSVLLAGKGKKLKIARSWYLSPVNPSLAYRIGGIPKPALALGVLAVLGGGGYMAYSEYQQRALEAWQAAQVMHQPVVEAPPPPPPPWVSKPAAETFVRSCLWALNQVVLFPGNWNLGDISCTQQGLSVSWTAQPRVGWIDHLRAIDPHITLEANGTTATRLVALPEMNPAGDEPLPLKNERIMAMHAAAQRHMIEISITPTPPPPAPPTLPGQVADPAAAPVAPTWQSMNWRIQGVIAPHAVLGALDPRGLRVTSLTARWSDGRLSWSIEGVQYVQ